MVGLLGHLMQWPTLENLRLHGLGMVLIEDLKYS
jgi:hypothetical protein